MTQSIQRLRALAAAPSFELQPWQTEFMEWLSKQPHYAIPINKSGPAVKTMYKFDLASEFSDKRKLVLRLNHSFSLVPKSAKELATKNVLISANFGPAGKFLTVVALSDKMFKEQE